MNLARGHEGTGRLMTRRARDFIRLFLCHCVQVLSSNFLHWCLSAAPGMCIFMASLHVYQLSIITSQRMQESSMLFFTRRELLIFYPTHLPLVFLPLFFPQPSVERQVHWPGKNKVSISVQSPTLKVVAVCSYQQISDDCTTAQFSSNELFRPIS